jgi:hypothetical protein
VAFTKVEKCLICSALGSMLLKDFFALQIFEEISSKHKKHKNTAFGRLLFRQTFFGKILIQTPKRSLFFSRSLIKNSPRDKDQFYNTNLFFLYLSQVARIPLATKQS